MKQIMVLVIFLLTLSCKSDNESESNYLPLFQRNMNFLSKIRAKKVDKRIKLIFLNNPFGFDSSYILVLRAKHYQYGDSVFYIGKYKDKINIFIPSSIDYIGFIAYFYDKKKECYIYERKDGIVTESTPSTKYLYVVFLPEKEILYNVHFFLE